MGMLASLVWRNIWRNRRRSMISIASVVFAVVLALCMRSMQLGFYAQAVSNVVSFQTGYAQVHASGFDADRSVDRSFAAGDSLAAMIAGTDGVTNTAPRLEVFALVAGDRLTDGAMIIGIDPAAEDRLTGLARRVTEGEYLAADDKGILLPAGLADHLSASVGDTVVVLGQGYHGLTAAGIFEIRGIVEFPTPDLNAGLGFMTLTSARDLTGAYGRLTTLALMISDQNALDEIAQSLRTELGDSFEVLTWKQMMPELVQFIQTDNASGMIMLMIVYLVIAFGILGTTLMMTMERTHEFGVLIAVGMKRSWLRWMLIMESIVLSFFGAVVGALAAVPIIAHFHAHPLQMSGSAAEATVAFGFEPIMPFLLEPGIFVNQSLVILAIALAASLYPVIRIAHLDPVTAMHEG